MTMALTTSNKLLALALLTAAPFAPGCTADDDAMLADDEVDAEADADVAVADVIELDGLGIVAPPPGTSVWAERIFDDGTMRSVVLHTDLAGVVFVEEVDDELPGDDSPDLASPLPGPTALSVCDDGAYKLNGYKWNKTLQWSFNSGSTPSGLSTDSVESKLKAGMSNITNSDNSSGFSDLVSATHSYLGRKAKGPNIDASGNCTSNDGANAVGFGDLPAGVLGVACTWFSNGIAVNSDIKFNKVDHKWTTNPTSDSCSNKFSVEGVMTHEAGHAFGLGHVSESSHPGMTMSTKSAPCQNSESTLGRGDVLGLRQYY
jgi:hypothetical protein